MKIGTDSYCFHRFFGEVYPGQPAPVRRMTMEDFLAFAAELEVDGVSLESCFFPSMEQSWFRDLKAALDAAGFDRVYAWGHPDGLEAGNNRRALDDLIAQIPHAALIGAEVMRVVGSSLLFRHEPHQPQLDVLARWFTEAVTVAEQYGIKLAVENHIDYTADEILWSVDRRETPTAHRVPRMHRPSPAMYTGQRRARAEP